jgi:DNA-binding NtrC family response regulator
MEKQVNVLFIDDEPYMLSAIERVFRSDRYGVAVTTSPEEAIELMHRHPIKVVLSDQRMPTTSGLNFLKKVKELFPDKVRILVSGYDDMSIAREEVVRGDIRQFISKPWDAEFLKVSIMEAMEQYDRQHSS